MATKWHDMVYRERPEQKLAPSVPCHCGVCPFNDKRGRCDVPGMIQISDTGGCRSGEKAVAERGDPGIQILPMTCDDPQQIKCVDLST